MQIFFLYFVISTKILDLITIFATVQKIIYIYKIIHRVRVELRFIEGLNIIMIIEFLYLFHFYP